MRERADRPAPESTPAPRADGGWGEASRASRKRPWHEAPGWANYLRHQASRRAASDPAAGALLERQADAVADAVTSGAPAPAVSAAPTAPVALQAKRSAHAAAPAAGPTPAPPSLHVPRGGSEPLPALARRPLERAFGADLSDVRVHHGPAADDAARALDARAFTVGRDVVFRRGEYRPHEGAGQRLLAHELTHVVQQRATGEALQRHGDRRDAPAPAFALLVPWRGSVARSLTEFVRGVVAPGALQPLVDALLGRIGGHQILRGESVTAGEFTADLNRRARSFWLDRELAQIVVEHSGRTLAQLRQYALDLHRAEAAIGEAEQALRAFDASARPWGPADVRRVSDLVMDRLVGATTEQDSHDIVEALLALTPGQIREVLAHFQARYGTHEAFAVLFSRSGEPGPEQMLYWLFEDLTAPDRRRLGRALVRGGVFEAAAVQALSEGRP